MILRVTCCFIAGSNRVYVQVLPLTSFLVECEKITRYIFSKVF